MACFHNKCGKRVTLLNNNCTAVRSICEFNHGIVLSAEPLINDSLFEVKIDKKVNAWSGNIEIGVIATHPESIDLPACALALRNGSWIMSGNSVLKDGQPVTECYGEDLDKLSEGDRIGVMRTSHGELVIFINGTPQGIAAEGLPSTVYAVVDMYGKCVQVSMVTSIPLEHDNEENMNCSYSQLTLEQELMSGLQSSLQSNLSELSLDIQQDWNVSLNIPLESNETASNVTRPVDTIQRDRLHFHSRCGTFVKLTSNFRTAERRRPLDEFNNGVVMTHRPLIDDELFEIRIDRLVDKWSGSIEVGVTTHNPNLLEFPATMTNMRSGTIMMSGCGILTNGKGTRREYGEFNLDELREGDRVGMMRKSNGNLHYFINGMDQGIAASKVAQSVWGVIDLYGMTIKVTIVDRDEREEQNLITRRNTLLQDMSLNIHELSCDFDCHDRLTFHTNCGTHADVINNGRTAHRPNAMDDFNNGVVLTARPLKPNEQFEVRLDKVVTKWAGSIEIGVTTHLPTELEFPFTMTNVRSGTWMMTGNGVMHNGTTIIDHYGMNLDRLQVGDRVAVIRKDTGTIHFFVNGVDQGPAATNIPERVYGVIDLYGQAAQVTIQDSLDCYSPETINSSISNTTLYTDLRFHHLHGKNARISNNGMTASRTRAFAEFNDAIVFSNRQLRDDEIFEIVLDKMVDRWSGSIELGVTSMRPDEIDLPSTATDLDQYTWMLSGAVVMENGITLKNGYNCDLDTLAVDTKIGVSRKTNGMLHFYRDGIDQGPACRVPRTGVYAVIDLYGQCAQVSLAGARCTTATGVPSSPPQSEEPTPASLQASIIQQPLCGQNQIPATDSYLAHRFSEWHGKNITLAENNTNASRNRNSSYCLVFSSNSLTTDELFEVGILSVAPQYAGNIKIGVTSVNVIDPKFYTNIPANISSIPGDYWYISGNEVRMKNRVISSSFCPSLDWLGIGDRIGIRRGPDGTIRIIINSEDMGPVFTNVPEGVFVMIELYGRTSSIHVTSARTPQPPLNTAMSLSMSPLTSLKLHDSLELVLDPPSHQYQPGGRQDSCTLASVAADATDAESISETVDRYEFYENHGRNIEILPNRVTARRVASYNQGVIIVAKPLIKGQMLEVKIEQVNEKWTSSLMVGVVCMPPSRINFPITALGFKKHCWIICSDWLSINGTKIKSNYGSILEHVSVGSRIGLILSETGRLSLCVDGVRLGPLPASLPLMAVYHAVFDLYGQCEQISILNNLVDNMDMLESKHSTAMLSNQFEECCEQPPASTSVDKVDNQQYEKADLESHEKESNIVLEQNDVEADSNLISSSDNDYAEIIDGENLNLDNNPALINSMTTSFQAMTLSIHANYSKKCEYLKECVKFKKSLVLPEEFFAPEDPMCYCNNCYQSNSSDMFLQKGESPEENTLPFGYAKFVLNCSTSTTAMTEKWHVAYYGTKLNLIRPILDRGQPLTKEQLQWSNLISQPIEKGESSSSQIEFSPHLQYATLNSKHSYIDNCTKNKIEVSTAFQILVRPGSYSVRQVLDTPLSTEPNGANQTVQQSDKTSSCTNSVHEWYTKETGAIILNSLLIKLDCF